MEGDKAWVGSEPVTNQSSPVETYIVPWDESVCIVGQLTLEF